MEGNLILPDLDGKEVAPGCFLIGKPTPIKGTNKLKCLANFDGMLVLVELKLTFNNLD